MLSISMSSQVHQSLVAELLHCRFQRYAMKVKIASLSWVVREWNKAWSEPIMNSPDACPISIQWNRIFEDLLHKYLTIYKVLVA
jgi:hypothetical protein